MQRDFFFLPILPGFNPGLFIYYPFRIALLLTYLILTLFPCIRFPVISFNYMTWQKYFLSYFRLARKSIFLYAIYNFLYI